MAEGVGFETTEDMQYQRITDGFDPKQTRSSQLVNDYHLSMVMVVVNSP